MPASTRRALGALVAVMGIIIVVGGSWVVVKLGPSGEARFSAASRSPGAIVVPPEVLNAVDLPVRVTASRPARGSVLLSVAASSDARAILSTSAVSTVSAVHFPAGTLDLRASGAGAVPDLSTADVWRVAISAPGSAVLVVDQARAPETVVVSSGDTTALKDVTVTLRWANRSWFFVALALATLGAVLAVFAINDLWQGRLGAAPGTVAEAKTSTVAG